MILTAPILALTPQETPEPSKAATCYAYVMLDIGEAMAESGRVAGPSWFVRDYWEERLTEDELDAAAQEAAEEIMKGRKDTDTDAYRTAGDACYDEPIDAGAVPGMGPDEDQ